MTVHVPDLNEDVGEIVT